MSNSKQDFSGQGMDTQHLYRLYLDSYIKGLTGRPPQSYSDDARMSIMQTIAFGYGHGCTKSSSLSLVDFEVAITRALDGARASLV